MNKYEHDGCKGCKYNNFDNSCKEGTNCIQNATDKYIPAPDIVEVKHGHLVIRKRRIREYHTEECPLCNHIWKKSDIVEVDECLCSECNAVIAHSFQNYCPRCGAKMDAEQTTEPYLAF